MKKVVLIVLLSMFSFSNAISLAKNMETKIGTGLPTLGWATHNSEGNIIGYSGFNILLGYSSVNYFDELKINAWNPYWQWGTVMLLFPYVGIGTEYVADNGFFFDIGTFYFAPYVALGVNF
ncbi:hypothetical protein OSSY52_07260 [Tepiditoga spiralis]|uniref:Uncharacterized protein n=1 Tax=Tepiditoga spiralis TaxID=2108365 RepID=A0A7G1G3J0_9BACT|nr:hypothetical protein [Tepiditoga spiralis]BBE30585.1 hypothetical protein OSSY52_07260 [Tepiditoga spiralis]